MIALAFINGSESHLSPSTEIALGSMRFRGAL
jgi:hypothetical protein